MGSNQHVLGILLLLASATACSKPCQEFADRVCERTSSDMDECNTAGSKELDERCKKMRAIVASCRDLKKEPAAASDADNAQCKANLELLSALERQQQQR